MALRWYLVRAFVVAKLTDLSLEASSVACERAWISQMHCNKRVKGHNVGQMYGTRAPRAQDTRCHNKEFSQKCLAHRRRTTGGQAFLFFFPRARAVAPHKSMKEPIVNTKTITKYFATIERERDTLEFVIDLP